MAKTSSAVAEFADPAPDDGRQELQREMHNYQQEGSPGHTIEANQAAIREATTDPETTPVQAAMDQQDPDAVEPTPGIEKFERAEQTGPDQQPAESEISPDLEAAIARERETLQEHGVQPGGVSEQQQAEQISEAGETLQAGGVEVDDRNYQFVATSEAGQSQIETADSPAVDAFADSPDNAPAQQMQQEMDQDCEPDQ